MNYWIFVSFLATFISASLMIILKIIGNLKIKQTLFVALMFIFTGLIALIYILFHKNECNKLLQYENKSKILFLIILFVVLLIAYEIICFEAMNSTPNIAYCQMIINLNIILTLLAGYLLFKQKINWKTLIGIILTLLGITIMITYSNT